MGLKLLARSGEAGLRAVLLGNLGTQKLGCLEHRRTRPFVSKIVALPHERLAGAAPQVELHTTQLSS